MRTRVITHTNKDNIHQPSVPAQEGLIITGTPTHDVMPLGIMGGMDTGAPSHTVGTQNSLGLLLLVSNLYRLCREMNQLKSWCL